MSDREEPERLMDEVRAAAHRWYPDGDFTLDLFEDPGGPFLTDGARVFKALLIRPALKDGEGWNGRVKSGVIGDATGIRLALERPWASVPEGCLYPNVASTPELRAELTARR